MIVFDQTTILGFAPVALTALLALLTVIIDLAWPERPNLITGFGAVGVLAIMALTSSSGRWPTASGCCQAQTSFSAASTSATR